MLNLLPPQQKRELRLGILNQAITSTTIAVVFMILILALLLVVAQGFLTMNLEKANQELDFLQAKEEMKQLEGLEKEIKDLNRNLAFLDKHYKERNLFSLFLDSLITDVPSGIRFNEIDINESDRINISGHASTREILLVFKSNLERASYVSNFDFPLANLTQARDINFFLSFQVSTNYK